MTKVNNERAQAQQNEIIKTLNFLGFLKKHIKLLVAGVLLGALAGWVLSNYVVEKKYSSYVDLYIKNKTGEVTDSVEYSDISSAQKLAGTYMVILQSNKVTKSVTSKLDKQISSGELLRMTSFSSVQNTEVLRIYVSTNDPQLTKDICDAYMSTAQEALDSVVGAGSVKVISEPSYPSHYSYPNNKKFAMTGAGIGLVLMVGLCLVLMRLDRKITDESMLKEQYSIPVLGCVPDFFQFAKELGLSRREVKKSQKLKENNPENEKIATRAIVLNDNTPFPIKEAYNGIRSNILFSLTNMKNGIIVVTSPGANDLKTTTSINLAFAMGQIGANVLLIDCDLRNPSIFRLLKLSNKKGLSNVITGLERFENSVVRNVSTGVDFLSAGPATQRPSELLGSSYMIDFLKRQAYYYDFVIIDTSPLGAVSDSLAMMADAAGTVLVVRENKTTIDELNRAIEAINMANGKVFGFILTDVNTVSGKYGKYGYGKYGYGYGYGPKENKKKK